MAKNNAVKPDRFTFTGDLADATETLRGIEIVATFTVSCYGGEQKGDKGVEVTETFVIDEAAQGVLSAFMRSKVIDRQRAYRTSGKVGGTEQEVYARIEAHASKGAKVLTSEAGHSPWTPPRTTKDPLQAAAAQVARMTDEQREALRALLEAAESGK
jgi:hypothetical protein